MDKIDESYGSRSAGLITQIPRVRISRSNLTLVRSLKTGDLKQLLGRPELSWSEAIRS